METLSTINIPLRIQVKARIMAQMLNGSIEWNTGCAMRNWLDTLSDVEIEEEIDKHGHVVYN